MSDPPKTRAKVLRIQNDDFAIGRLAARTLQDKGLRHFAYIRTDASETWERDRGMAFSKALRSHGFSAVECVLSSSDTLASQQDALVSFIKGLPKPCGLFAAFDQLAKFTLDACRHADVPVPESVLVLGVDNAQWICDNSVPTLSSIDGDFRNGGFVAAERLDALLRGRRFASREIRFKPLGVIERSSTADILCKSRRVSDAREFIRTHAIESIAVGDVAAATHTSLRLLQMHFRQIVGHGIAEEIRLHRLQYARHLLSTTETPINRITEFCKLGTMSTAHRLFRKQFGVTMTAWRQKRQ